MSTPERSRCSVEGCENIVELTAKGHERRYCRRHRGGSVEATEARPQTSSPAVPKPDDGLRGVARKTIRDVINDTITPERVQQLIDDVLTTTRQTWGSCPNCRKRVPVEVPDPAKAVQVLKELLEQAEGKPRDGESAGTTILVQRPPR